jgi:ribosome modulation factor
VASVRSVSIVGAKETVRILKQFEPDFAKEFESELREVGNEVAGRARGMTPASALSGWTTWRGGWNQGSVRAGITTRTFPRRKFGTTEQYLVGVGSKDAAGAIFERAGIKNRPKAPQGQSFIDNLRDKHGGGLRLVGRAQNQKLGETQRRVEKIVERAKGDLQDSLNQAGVTRI